MDEAMHPLDLAVGLCGETCQSERRAASSRGAVKYGFKGIKSIVKVRFLAKQPVSSWQINWPQAYGFYANVNPAVAHPRHTQAVEARLPSLFQTTRTLPFNGYGDQVASLYAGMDLRRDY
jgi:sulfoxide reductase catalytic subunit YedY